VWCVLATMAPSQVVPADGCLQATLSCGCCDTRSTSRGGSHVSPTCAHICTTRRCIHSATWHTLRPRNRFRKNVRQIVCIACGGGAQPFDAGVVGPIGAVDVVLLQRLPMNNRSPTMHAVWTLHDTIACLSIPT
jgi:hypothetical protein